MALRGIARLLFLGLGLGLGLAVLTGPALAENPPAEPFSTRPVRLLVPFAPGGPTDMLARAIAEPAGRRLGTTIQVENRPGASGLVSNEACARAVPDGTTLCIGAVITHSMLPHMHPGRVGADAAGFTPILRIGDEPSLVAVRADHPAPQMPGFGEWASGRDLVHVGISAIGSSYLMFAQVAQVAQFRPEVVMYRGGSTVQTALLSGEVPVAVGPVSLFIGAIRAGQIRPVLVMGPTRSRSLPDVPTVAETVIEGFGFATYTAVFGPAGMARATVARVEAAIAETLREPAVRSRIEDLGFELNITGSADFARYLAQSAPEWRRLIEQHRAAMAAATAR